MSTKKYLYNQFSKQRQSHIRIGSNWSRLQASHWTTKGFVAGMCRLVISGFIGKQKAFRTVTSNIHFVIFSDTVVVLFSSISY